MVTEEEILQQQNTESKLKSTALSTDIMNQAILTEKKEESLGIQQLDLTVEMREIEYLLKGYILQADEYGQEIWVDSKDERLKILTDFGVQKILQVLRSYLNKNTLLSNYDDDTILNKMEDFGETLADNIFMRYDEYFLYPSFEAVKEEFEKRIKNKTELRKYAYEIIGEEKAEEDIKKELLKEVEGKIEREFGVIREQLMKNKLKDFEIIMRQIEDIVHSAYQRAWKGEERTGLRRHYHVSELKGGQTPERKHDTNPFGFGRRR